MTKTQTLAGEDRIITESILRSFHNFRYDVVAVLLALLFSLTCGAGVARATEIEVSSGPDQEVTPADVFYAVQQINQHIELLRRHMGEPEANLLDIRISQVAPHDVYFQALTLFEKTNRLLFEIIRQEEQPPPLLKGFVRPADVLSLVKKAHYCTHRLIGDFNIHENSIKPTRDEPKTPTDVFLALLRINRQINQLLERRFAPSDVYKEVTRAIGYAARQLARYPHTKRIPKKPPFEKERKPSDVYFQLLECINIITRIYQTVGLDIIEIDSSRINEKNIRPSDVFDIASLVVARLDFLHKHFALTELPRESFYPGRKFPSDVYQHVGILKKQLLHLEGLMAEEKKSARK